MKNSYFIYPFISLLFIGKINYAQILEPDQDFGTNGVAKAVTPPYKSYASLTALQPDGKIVCAGAIRTASGQYRWQLARFNINGALDTTFGNQGTLITATGYWDFPSAIAVQPNSKIIISGQSSGTLDSLFVGQDRSVIARYNHDGSLDSNFGTGGKVEFRMRVENGGGYVNSVALQQDGKILVGGGATIGNVGSETAHFALARFNSDGALDSTFGNNGKTFTSIENLAFSGINVIALQQDGKIVAAGSSGEGGLNDQDHKFALARYHTNGTIDNSFGNNGRVATDFEPNLIRDNFATHMIIQPDNKILVSGNTSYNSGSTKGLTVARYQGDGQLDAFFGNAGKILDYNSKPSNGMVIAGDGGVFLSQGSDIAGTGSDIFISKYRRDGTVDSGFGTNGKVAINFSANELNIGGILQQPDYKIILTGSSRDTSANLHSMTLVRLKGDFVSGINDHLLPKHAVSIYPNPANGQVYYTLDVTLKDNTKLNVFNSVGQKIHTKRVSQKKGSIDLSPYPAGIYFIELKAETGKRTVKVIKNR